MKATVYVCFEEFEGVAYGPEWFYTEAEADAWALQKKRFLLSPDPYTEEDWEMLVESGKGDVLVYEIEIDTNLLVEDSE